MAKGDQNPELLRELQAMPMEAKILLTQARLDEFWTGYNTIGWGNAYVSYSGGKDSTVLLDIARKRYPDIPAVFSNTGLEYPEIRKFAQSHDNVETVHPKMRFDEVISRYGYPLIGKEVAEAIYYARKITSAEREREETGESARTTATSYRKRTEVLGNRPIGNDRNCGGGGVAAGQNSREHSQRTSRGTEIEEPG